MFAHRNRGIVVAAVLFLVGAVRADVVIPTVPVGNAGNPGELSGVGAGGSGPDRVCGAVGYEYRIGTYEVTAGQYADFLNAVAKTDTYGLYNSRMWSDLYGCKIQKIGGSYIAHSPDRPVNFVSFWDACRFANWLHNGQPVGLQNETTTENGAYDHLYNDTGGSGVRLPGARWFIPTEDEWYKAAYHKNDGPTGNYWDYPNASDTVPSSIPTLLDELSRPSPYGTRKQGGSMLEWNETITWTNGIYTHRGQRGASSYHDNPLWMAANCRMFSGSGRYPFPTEEGYEIGFRVAAMAEPVAPPPPVAVPLPVAVWPALSLMGAMAVVRLKRRA